MAELLGQIVVCFPPVSPPGAVDKVIVADDPLSLDQSSSPHNTEYTITDGKTFYIQKITIGSSKDPSEKGNRIEIVYDDGSEKLLARYYSCSETTEYILPNRSTTRDSTVMVGNGSHKLIIRRIALSSPSREVDVVVEGYEE